MVDYHSHSNITLNPTCLFELPGVESGVDVCSSQPLLFALLDVDMIGHGNVVTSSFKQLMGHSWLLNLTVGALQNIHGVHGEDSVRRWDASAEANEAVHSKMIARVPSLLVDEGRKAMSRWESQVRGGPKCEIVNVEHADIAPHLVDAHGLVETHHLGGRLAGQSLHPVQIHVVLAFGVIGS